MEEIRAEQIRCREVSRALSGMNLSLKAEEVIERLSRSLVNELLRGRLVVAASLSARVGMSEVGRDACAS